jgi:hypothetical protein
VSDALVCHFVELALDAAAFPDGPSFARLYERLMRLGKLKCVEIALAPSGGGRVSFVIHEPAAPQSVRGALAELVGEKAITRCTARSA